jgi:hypothetical protein
VVSDDWSVRIGLNVQWSGERQLQVLRHAIRQLRLHHARAAAPVEPEIETPSALGIRRRAETEDRSVVGRAHGQASAAAIQAARLTEIVAR